MGLGGISILWAALMATAVATGLVLLHRLRTIAQQKQVPTLMFWKAATAQPQSRWIRGRFRYPRTFAFLLAIGLLLIAVLVRPTWSADQVQPQVVVLDAGLSMAAITSDAGQTRLEQAIDLLLEQHTAQARSGRLAVIVADPLPRVLLQFGQPAELLRDRLSQLRPSDLPAASDSAIQLALSLANSHDPCKITWYTDRVSISEQFSEQQKIQIQRQAVGRPIARSAIVSAWVEPTADRWQVRIRVAQWSDQSRPVRIDLAVEGQPATSQEQSIAADGAIDFVFPVQATQGTKIRTSIASNERLMADQQVELILPGRQEVRFTLRQEIAAPLKIALSAAGSLVPATDAQAVQVGDESIASGPAIVVVRRGNRRVPAGQVLTVNSRSPLMAGLDFEYAFSGEGPDLRGLDVNGSATVSEPLILSGEAVLAGFTQETRPRLLISQALLTPDSTFWRRATFALFIDRASRHLVGASALPYGINAQRQLADPTWASVDPGEAIAVPGGRTVSNLNLVSATADQPKASVRVAWPEPFEILLAIALLLLIAESLLHAKGRIV